MDKGVGRSATTNRFRRVLPETTVSLIAGLAVLGLIAVVTRTPAGNSTGFPFAWSSPIARCPVVNPYNGCGFSYSIPIVVLDYAIWTTVIFVLIVVAGLSLRGRAPG
jgi:hypothetical protein